jgi:hypothetical protein
MLRKLTFLARALGESWPVPRIFTDANGRAEPLVFTPEYSSGNIRFGSGALTRLRTRYAPLAVRRIR